MGTNLWIFVADPNVAYQVNNQALQKSDEYTYLGQPFLHKGKVGSNFSLCSNVCQTIMFVETVQINDISTSIQIITINFQFNVSPINLQGRYSKIAVICMYILHPHFIMISGVLTTNDLPHWKKSRKIFMNGLSAENLKSFIPIFHEESLKVMDIIKKYAITHENVYPPKLFYRYTLSCIAKCVLNFDIEMKNERENQDFIEGVHKVFEVKNI